MVKPIIIGVIIVIAPGNIISLRAAFVEISTHFPYSGVPVPSIIPGISLNCRLTSITMSIAAFPTDFIANAEKTTGIMPPMKRAASTSALKILIPSMPVKVT